MYIWGVGCVGRQVGSESGQKLSPKLSRLSNVCMLLVRWWLSLIWKGGLACCLIWCDALVLTFLTRYEVDEEFSVPKKLQRFLIVGVPMPRCS